MAFAAPPGFSREKNKFVLVFEKTLDFFPPYRYDYKDVPR
jgi:hypothetical protein